MDLREYLFQKDKKFSQFAREINYSRNYLNEVALGTKPAGKKLAGIIEKATNGSVKAEEVLKISQKKQNAANQAEGHNPKE